MTVTRRALLAVSLLALLAGCPPAGPPPPPSGGGAAAGPNQLELLIYSEYIDPALLAEFEQKHGAPVKVSLFESPDEMLQKVQLGGGKSQFDLIVASSQHVATMARLGLIKRLDHAALPNLGNVAPRFKDAAYDPGFAHSVPYQWGTVGILWDKEKVKALEPSWSVIFDPAKQPGTFWLIDDMRDQLGAALKSLGHSVNSGDAAQLKAAGELVLKAKQSEKCLGFEGGVGGKNKVLGGTADLAVVWNGDALKAIDESKGRLAFAIPAEGASCWVDCMVIPAEAPRPDLAHAFIDFILDPQVGARLSNFNRYASPNQAALPHIRPEDRDNPCVYPPEALLAKLELLADLGEGAKLYDEVWTAVKSR